MFGQCYQHVKASATIRQNHSIQIYEIVIPHHAFSAKLVTREMWT